MPGVRRKDRAKTQPVTFEAEGKAEAAEASAAEETFKRPLPPAAAAAATLGSVRRHVRSDSTPNMPALQEAVMAAQNGGGDDEDDDKVKWPVRPGQRTLTKPPEPASGRSSSYTTQIS